MTKSPSRTKKAGSAKRTPGVREPQGLGRELLAPLLAAEDLTAFALDMPPHDLLLALAAARPDERVTVLAALPKEAFDLQVDLVAWTDDQPDLDALADWLAPLALASAELADHAYFTLEPELRTLLIKKHCRAHLRENRDDEPEIPETSEYLETPDRTYVIELPEPALVPDAVRGLIEALLLRPFEEYQPELECLRHDLPSELAELARRWRGGRLADYGFPGREEALALLVPRPVAEVRERAHAARRAGARPAPLGLVPARVWRASLAGRAFLDEVWRRLPAAAAVSGTEPTHLEAQLSALVSRFVAALGVPLTDVSALQHGALLARDLLCLGLQAVSEDDPDEAAGLALGTAPGFFLQAGLGVLAPLVERARALHRRDRVRFGARVETLFDAPYHSVIRGLLRVPPMRDRRLGDAEGDRAFDLPDALTDDWTGFGSLDEVARIRRLLDEMEHLDELVFDALGAAGGEVPPGPASRLVMTALARASLGGPLIVTPLAPDEAALAQARVLDVDEESLLHEALGALWGSLGVAPGRTLEPDGEPDAHRRLILRLLLLGRSRLAAAPPELALWVEPGAA